MTRVDGPQNLPPVAPTEQSANTAKANPTAPAQATKPAQAHDHHAHEHRKGHVAMNSARPQTTEEAIQPPGDERRAIHPRAATWSHSVREKMLAIADDPKLCRAFAMGVVQPGFRAIG